MEEKGVKLDCALAMDALREVPDVARAAEETGFAAMWANDTKHNPFVTLTTAALNTSRLELGTGVAVAFARSPMIVAQTAWDLARLSGGRFILGLGTQVRAHIERRFGMTWDPPVPKLREYIAVLRAVWRTWQDGVPLRVEGTYYKISLMGPFFDPGPHPYARIPIFIAGVGRLLCQLAGEIGDGFVVHPLHSVAYLREVVLPNLTAGLARSGRARSDVQLYAPVFLAPGNTTAEVHAAVARARARMAFYGSTPTYRPMLDVLGYADVADRLHQLVRERRMEELGGQLPDAVVEAVVLRGSYEEIGRALRARYDGLVDRVASYWPFTPAEQDGWKRLVDAFQAA
jgi:probable F420-dependent oxidoreductase